MIAFVVIVQCDHESRGKKCSKIHQERGSNCTTLWQSHVIEGDLPKGWKRTKEGWMCPKHSGSKA